MTPDLSGRLARALRTSEKMIGIGEHITMKRIRAAILILAMSVLWGGCAAPAANAEAVDAHNLMAFGENRRIIIDSDTGGDDALAILMAAKSPKSPLRA